MFSSAINLRCSNHLRQNLKEKLSTLNLELRVSKEMLSDVFGRQVGTHLESGLVDANSKTIFCTALKRLKDRWNNL